MESKKEELYSVIIPRNVMSGKRHMGFKSRNILEGIILAALICLFITRIPFVPRIKTILCLILGISAFLISCIGIRNRSITEFVSDYKNFKNMQKNYHLRSVKKAAAKKKKFIFQEGKAYVNDFSIETTIFKIKESIADFKQKYGFR